MVDSPWLPSVALSSVRVSFRTRNVWFAQTTRQCGDGSRSGSLMAMVATLPRCEGQSPGRGSNARSGRPAAAVSVDSDVPMLGSEETVEGVDGRDCEP